MKKFFYLIITLFILTASVNPVNAADVKKELTTEQQVRLDAISKRVQEIKQMDRSTLSAEEKKQIRTELKQLKKEAYAVSNGGIYLSVTALLVIIIILLIL